MNEPNPHVKLLTEPPSIEAVREGEYVVVVGVPPTFYTRQEINHLQIAFAGRPEFVSFAARGLPHNVKTVLTTESCASHLAHEDTFHANIRIHVLGSPQKIREALSLITFTGGQNFANTLDNSQTIATETIRPKLKDKVKVAEIKPEAPRPARSRKQLPASNSFPPAKQPPATIAKPNSQLPSPEQLRYAAEETRDDFWGNRRPCTIGGADFANRPHVARAFIMLYPNASAEQIRQVVLDLDTPYPLACEVYNTAKQMLDRQNGKRPANTEPASLSHHNNGGALSLEEENVLLRRLLLQAITTLDTINKELTRFQP